MDLRRLRYFVAVAEELHITRAARRLGMQQPPLSQQIRLLEQEIGAALFRRLPRGVSLTPAGEAFLEGARATLAQGERAALRARLAAAGQVGRLTIGLTSSAALHPLVARLLGAYRCAHPAVALDVQEADAADLTEAVASGAVDAGFLRAPVAMPLGLAFLELARERFVVALPAEHRLPGPAVSLRDLAAERFILVRRPAGSGMYAGLLEACRGAGFEPLVALEVRRMLTALSLVAAGMGVAAVPASTGAIALPGVRYAALSGEGAPTAPLTLAHRAGEARPAVTALLDAARG